MNAATLATPAVDRLRAVAIRRNGKVHSAAKGGSHYQLRVSLSGADQKFLGDVEGFITEAGNFLTRHEAVGVGVLSGQLHESWLQARRDLLSSDINW